MLSATGLLSAPGPLSAVAKGTATSAMADSAELPVSAGAPMTAPSAARKSRDTLISGTHPHIPPARPPRAESQGQLQPPSRPFRHGTPCRAAETLG